MGQRHIGPCVGEQVQSFPRKRTSPWHGSHLRVVEPGGANSSTGWGVLSLSPQAASHQLGDLEWPWASYFLSTRSQFSHLENEGAEPVKFKGSFLVDSSLICEVQRWEFQNTVKLGQGPPTSEASNVHSLLQIHAHILRTSIYHRKCMSALRLVPCGLFGRHKFKLITFWWPFSNDFSLFFFQQRFFF